MRVLKVEQDVERWHKLRTQFVTATEANRLKNQENWNGMLKDKLIGKRSKFKSKAMIKGLMLESEARDALNNSSDQYDFKPVCVVDDKLGAMASLDGAEPTFTINIEIKCPEKDEKSDLYYKALDKKIPSHYRDQMQFQMMVTGAQHTIYVVYIGKGNYKLILYPRNELIILRFRKLLREFWAYSKIYLQQNLTQAA